MHVYHIFITLVGKSPRYDEEYSESIRWEAKQKTDEMSTKMFIAVSACAGQLC